jgi:hypothetical protein
VDAQGLVWIFNPDRGIKEGRKTMTHKKPAQFAAYKN